MTSIGHYGNSNFAMNNKSALKINTGSKNAIIKKSELPLFNKKNKLNRFSDIIDYLLSENHSLFFKIANNSDIKLIILDNFNASEKDILLEKIKLNTGSNLLDRVLFTPNNRISKLLNKLANSNENEHIFILGLNLNKHRENSGECALIIELKSKFNLDEIKLNIHQSAEIEDDNNIGSVISFGNCSPNELETVWYSNMTDFEISQISYKLNEIDVKSKPNFINIDTVFGITEELSELLLISLAIEQTNQSGLPQLIANSPSQYNSRVISKNQF